MEDNQKLIEEMMRDAEKADEPGTFRPGRVINQGDDDLSSPMVAMKLKSAGHTPIYDTHTGDRSITNNNMLLAQLKKTRPDGSNVFATVKPKVLPHRGTLECMLHKNNVNRDHYNFLGLPECPKSNLTNPLQVKRHMQKRHKVEWQTLEEERIAREKQEDRDFQRSVISQATPTERLEAKAQTEKIIGGEFKCDKCGESFAKKIALTGHQRKHK